MISLFLSIISGLLTGLSFDSAAFSFLIWVSLLPFIYTINRISIKQGILNSFLFGFFYFGVAIFWVGNVTKLGLVFLLFYLAFYPALFFLIARYILKKSLAIVTVPALWVILEFLKENIWCGFGWANLGYSQYKNLYFIQIADLWGVKFISFLIVMFNILLWEIISKHKFILRKSIVVLFILLSCLGYSFYRFNNFKSEKSLGISLVQPNVPQELKWQESSNSDIVEKLKRLSRETEKDSLVIFPEASWPFVIDENNFGILKEFVEEIKRNILVGAVEEEGNYFYNTALLFDKEGKLIDSYRKIKLVPFGEYVPLRDFLRFIKVINSIGDISKGREYKVFSYRDKKFSVLICFEDIFPLFVSGFSKKSDFLINITNDAWFKGEPEASQHLSIMVFRAIENRISIARCANTGISGWVSSMGEVTKLKNSGKDVLFEGVSNFNLPLNKKKSLYNSCGEIFTIFCALIILIRLIHK
jgi:apolipoprotein N-acyltransferase